MRDDEDTKPKLVRLEKQSAVDRLHIRSGSAAAVVNIDDNMLIDGIIPNSGLCALYGAPGSTKSFWSLTAALAVARGVPVHGREAEQGGVIYCALEGGGLFTNRIAAYCRHHDIDPRSGAIDNFHLVTDPIDLRSDTGSSAALLAAAAHELGGVKLIVVDTLNRAFAGGNENSPDDMGSFLREAAILASGSKAALLIVHHAGKDSAMGMRGHSSLLGAVDTELKITRNDSGCLLTVSKQRDGEDGTQFAYRTVEVMLGVSAKGREIKSLAIEGAAVEDVKGKPSIRYGDMETEIMRQVELLTTEPSALKTPDGVGWPGTPVPRCRKADVIDRASSNIIMPGDNRRVKTNGIHKAIDRLTQPGPKHSLGQNEGWLWLIR